MAKLLDQLPPGHWHPHIQSNGDHRCVEVDDNGHKAQAKQPCANFRDEMDAELRSLTTLPPDRVWKTSVADGYTHYYVHSENPLTLLHIPFGDRWNAHPALIRGLELQDVKEHTDREQRIQELFKKKGAEPSHTAEGGARLRLKTDLTAGNRTNTVLKRHTARPKHRQGN